jgi:type IV secretion system protein TrbD
MGMGDQAREVPVPQSPNLPNQLLGGDRELVIGAVMISILLGFGLGLPLGPLAGVLFWTASMWVLRRLAQADPLMRRIYFRHGRYRAFYPAKAGLYSKTLETPKGWR